MTATSTRVQDRNGVRVRVTVHKNGTSVETDCACMGIRGRVHSTLDCPLRQRLLAEETPSQRPNAPVVLVSEYAGHIAIVQGDSVTLHPNRAAAARALAEVL